MGFLRRRALALPAVLLLVVLSGCTTVVVGSPSAAEPAGPPPATSAGPTPAPTPAPGVVPLVIEPVVPGWNVVRSVNRAAAYDVPPTWTVRSESTIIGFEDDAGNRVASTGAATFGEDVCGDGDLALAVVRHDEGTDLTAASTVLAEAWADLAYRDEADARPTLTTGSPETITTVTGQQATVVEVTAALNSPATTCGITTGSVFAAAATGFTGEFGPTVVLVVVAAVGVPGAAPESEIRQMLTTLRPAS